MYITVLVVQVIGSEGRTNIIFISRRWKQVNFHLMWYVHFEVSDVNLLLLGVQREEGC